jgi:hypothetical protein
MMTKDNVPEPRAPRTGPRRCDAPTCDQPARFGYGPPGFDPPGWYCRKHRYVGEATAIKPKDKP